MSGGPTRVMLKVDICFKDKLECVLGIWFFNLVISRVEPKWEGSNEQMWAMIRCECLVDAIFCKLVWGKGGNEVR